MEEAGGRDHEKCARLSLGWVGELLQGERVVRDWLIVGPRGGVSAAGHRGGGLLMGGVQLAMTAEGEWNLTASALTIKGALVDLQATSKTEHLDYWSTTRWKWGQKGGKVAIRGRPPV